MIKKKNKREEKEMQEEKEVERKRGGREEEKGGREGQQVGMPCFLFSLFYICPIQGQPPIPLSFTAYN